MRKLVCTLLTTVLFMSLVLPAFAAPNGTEQETTFSDVPTDSWYYEPIMGIQQYGLIYGTGDGQFCPSGKATKAEALALACRINSYSKGKSLSQPPLNWEEDSIRYALHEGIGVSSELTNMDEPCSREQMCLFLFRAMPKDVRYLNMYNSVKDSNSPEILELYKLGIVQGVNSIAEFKGQANVTRAEMATIVYRIVDPTARIQIDFTLNGFIEAKGCQFQFLVRGNFSDKEIASFKRQIENVLETKVPDYLVASLYKNGVAFGFEQLDLMDARSSTEGVIAYYNNTRKRLVMGKVSGQIILHESGHFLQYTYGDMSRGKELYDKYKDTIAEICKDSYAKSTQRESFAEAYRLYTTYPKSLKDRCPEFYEHINEVVEKAKLDLAR